MIAGQRSRTIDRPALMRAAHQIVDDEPRIFRDPFAVGLTEGTSRDEIESRATEFLSPACRLLRSAIVLRSRYAEDQLAFAVQRGVAQYVLLGAGLDTFALRQGAQAGLRVFELDHAATQRWKLELLRSRGIEAAPNVTYVPMDLEVDSLDAALGRSGFQPQEAAFFSWLGVTQYLDARAVEVTLRYIAQLAPGSGVVFSFNPPDEALDGMDRAEARAAAERSGRIGEPWLTRPTAEVLAKRLRALKFRRIEYLTPHHAERAYFDGRRDGLRPPRFEQLFSAFV
jgi:methyltransferase (TIGR00027 family)